jgi:hypothetical protein
MKEKIKQKIKEKIGGKGPDSANLPKGKKPMGGMQKIKSKKPY